MDLEELEFDGFYPYKLKNSSNSIRTLSATFNNS